ncbi:MAG: porphobilinogen synthase [Myxococcaceae bacterium]
MRFPTTRTRRFRKSASLRQLVKETSLSPADFVYPLFVTEGEGVRRPIASMPGVFQFSVDQAVAHAHEVISLGVTSVIVFGVPDRKDAEGTSALGDSGVVQRALTALKKSLPTLVVMADICLCEFTDHGHCGVLSPGNDVDVDNDRTLPLLAQMATACARAGADVVAPSDMMDGRVAAIRAALDAAGFAQMPIVSYAAKYASAFYGPFRDAVQSAPKQGDRLGYQMDPANAREALREVSLDVAEGADAVIVKPALAYLDVIAKVRERFDVPVFAYNVSGEYAMLKAAVQAGWLEHDRAMLETLTAIRRAGADRIITYHALEASRLL